MTPIHGITSLRSKLDGWQNVLLLAYLYVHHIRIGEEIGVVPVRFPLTLKDGISYNNSTNVERGWIDKSAVCRILCLRIIILTYVSTVKVNFYSENNAYT